MKNIHKLRTYLIVGLVSVVVVGSIAYATVRLLRSPSDDVALSDESGISATDNNRTPGSSTPSQPDKTDKKNNNKKDKSESKSKKTKKSTKTKTLAKKSTTKPPVETSPPKSSPPKTKPPKTNPPSVPPTTSSFPTLQTTGPRYSAQSSSNGLSSTSTGQLIQRRNVTGRLTIRHDNVTVRDVKINGTGTYMITTAKKSNGQCPVNVRFEYIEIDGAQAAENDIPIYSGCGNMTVDHAYVHNVGRSSRLTNNMVITNSYVFSDRTGNSGAHRGAVGINGGSNNVLKNNVLKCEGVGCSAAIPNYGDFAAVSNFLIEHNLMATTGSYCAYGGSLSGKPYPNGSNIRFINNHFSTEYHPECGRYGPISGFANGVRGNQWRGNVWHETGKPLNL